MGAAGSIPEVMTREQAVELLGDQFNAGSWEAMADGDGNVTREQLENFEEPEDAAGGDDGGAGDEHFEAEGAAGGLGGGEGAAPMAAVTMENADGSLEFGLEEVRLTPISPSDHAYYHG